MRQQDDKHGSLEALQPMREFHVQVITMGIFDKFKGAKQHVEKKREENRERKRYKQEMEREKWKGETEDMERKQLYYTEKKAYETKKAEIREQKIRSTPVVGALYSTAKKFDAGKFAKATVEELRPPQRQILVRSSGRRKGRRGESAMQFYPPGYNPVEENLRRIQMPTNRGISMPNIDAGVRGKSQSMAYKQAGFGAQKIDPKLRKLMGV